MAQNLNAGVSGRTAAKPLTDAAIRVLRDGESRTDGSLPVGHGRLIIQCLKVRGTLRKTWIFRFRAARMSGKLKLGDYPAVVLDEARHKARLHIEQVRQGIDPRIATFEERQLTIQAQREKAALGTLRGLLSTYVANLRAKGRTSARDVELLFERHVLSPWPQLSDYPARAVTPEMMRDVLARMVKAGIGRQTNVLRSYLHAAFVHGAHADLDPRRAAEEAQVFRLTANPVQLLPRIAEFETTRDRVLSNEELRQLWKSLALEGVAIGATIRCVILLAGQRFRQLLRAKWVDYDRQTKVLRLSDPKGRRTRAVEHLLPISDKVAEEIELLVGLNDDGPFIFSTTSGAKPIHHTTLSSVIAAISRVTASADGAYRPGDIRRSAETRLQALGVSKDVRAQLLSHGRSSGVQARHYERHHYLAEKAEALKQWQGHLTSVITSRRRAGGSATRREVVPA